MKNKMMNVRNQTVKKDDKDEEQQREEDKRGNQPSWSRTGLCMEEIGMKSPPQGLVRRTHSPKSRTRNYE